MIGKHAYLYLRAKRFACVDLETGEEVWRSSGMADEYWSLVAQGEPGGRVRQRDLGRRRPVSVRIEDEVAVPGFRQEEGIQGPRADLSFDLGILEPS